jgi:hypothetical protein
MVGSGLVTSRTRPREAEASPAREPAFRVGRGLRAQETRDRKADRVPVDPDTAMVTVGFDDEDEDDRQGASQQEMVHMLGDMEI